MKQEENKKNYSDMAIEERRERKSASREAIREILERAGRPISAGDILARLDRRKRTFNKTTIYRELEAMKRMGRVREVFFRNDTALFEVAGEHHHHLVCVSCGDIRAVTLRESFVREAEKMSMREHFSILDHSLEFFGLCTACQK